MSEDRASVRFGVLGCADIAWRQMLPAMVSHDETEIACIASREGTKSARFARRFGGQPVTGYERLLERADVDAVYLPLPAELHADWVRRALLADKHVLVEKPLTTDAQQTADLLALARKRNLVLFENFMFLHHSQHAAVQALVADGAIGRLRGFASSFTIPPKPAGDIRYQAGVGGGALDDIGVYPIRAAAHFLGSDLTVAGAVLRSSKSHGTVLSGSVLLHTPEGVAAQLDFGMEHSYRTGYELRGSTGTITVDRVFTPPDTHQPVVRIERQDHREWLTLPADTQFANALDVFCGAVSGGRDVEGYADASLEHAALVSSVKSSARVVPVE